MKVQLISDGPGAKQYAVIFSTGDEAYSGLSEFANKYHVTSGHFTAIGALSSAVLAWFDPQKKIPRNGSRLNLVLLMRFDPATLGDTEQANTTDGVVAYSAICTHQQCPVTDWLRSVQMLQCPCHQSRYDPRQGAKVVGGPAPRPLPSLPLRLNNGVLDVAAPFTDRVGGMQQQGA